VAARDGAVAHDRTEDDQAHIASSAPAIDTESTDITSDGPRQPSTQVDDEAATPPAEPDQNGSGTTSASDSSDPGSSSPSDDPTGEPAAAPATTPEPSTMTTTETPDTSPSDGESDNTNGATSAAASTDAPAATPLPPSHDPVIDAVTTELPAVPASVRGLDDAAPAPAPVAAADGPGGASETNGGSATAPRDASSSGEAEAEPKAGSAAAAAAALAAAAGATAPTENLADTTEMPRIEAPAPSGDDARPVYEVRAAAVKADAPTVDGSAPTAEPPAPEPPVTEPVPTVIDRTANLGTTTSIGAPRDETRVLGPEERPRHFRATAGPAKPITGEVEKVVEPPKRRSRRALALVIPLVVVMLLIVAWAADTASLSGQVLRNVEVAGRQIGGKGEEALPEIMADVAAEAAERKVSIEIEGRPPYETSTAALGLVLDEDATTQAALDMGRGDTVFVRPLKWFKSFFSAREVPLQYTVTETQTAATLQLLQGADRTAPTDPSIQLTDAGFVATPGSEGQGVDISKVADDLLEEAQTTDGPIKITASAAPEEPHFTDEQAQQLADRANGLTADGLTLKADTVSVPVPAQQLRKWIKPTVAEGKLDLAFDKETANTELPGLFTELDAQPKNASMTLQGGTPTVVPGENGITCCGDDAADRVWEALQQDKGEATLEAVVKEPEITTEEVESWGIKEPVGGSRGYQAGAEIAGPAPGFTTYHAGGEPRVTNIHRIADIVRGTVIPPDGTFSVNDTVGQRTTGKGFVEAGAIRDGLHVPEVGGGVSQFATTTFNAAYFAGLDIEESQSHSEWFSRYPPGREATMGFPNPDLVIHNNTPYGVMIWTSYTDTSLTVTMWSTQYATAEQSGINETMSGACRVVTTTRTRTYPDRPSQNDTFRSTYRPGEGKTC
jgi:vancomycin resistance protein YoaR